MCTYFRLPLLYEEYDEAREQKAHTESAYSTDDKCYSISILSSFNLFSKNFI